MADLYPEIEPYETGYLDVVTLTADTKISSPSGVFKTEKK